MNTFTIDLVCIKQIILSYLMPDVLFESMQQVLRNIDGCNNLRIIKTTLIDNKQWARI